MERNPTTAGAHTPIQGELFSRYAKRDLTLHVLGSGSSGNAALIQGDEGSILVDAGFSARETFRRLDELSIDTHEICAIVVTHEHSDHVGGIGAVSRKLSVPVYATRGTASSPTFARQGVEVEAISAGDTFAIAGIDVTSFRISHDAADPIGMRFSHRGDSIGYMTDTGVVTPEATEVLRGVRVLALESNHDPQMLALGPYPQHLKKRIASSRGHLSNEQATDVLRTLVTDDLERVVAMHLSQTNNMPLISVRALEGCLRKLDHPATVEAAGQNRPRTCECSDE